MNAIPLIPIKSILKIKLRKQIIENKNMQEVEIEVVKKAKSICVLEKTFRTSPHHSGETSIRCCIPFSSTEITLGKSAKKRNRNKRFFFFF